MVLGVHFAPVELNLLRVLMTELRITASQAYPTEFPDVVEMLSSGEVDASPLVTHRYPLAEFSTRWPWRSNRTRRSRSWWTASPSASPSRR